MMRIAYILLSVLRNSFLLCLFHHFLLRDNRFPVLIALHPAADGNMHGNNP